MRQNRSDPTPPDATHAEGVVGEAPAGAGEPAEPKKKANAGDPELRAMARIVRSLDALSPAARERVGNYLAARCKGD